MKEKYMTIIGAGLVGSLLGRVKKLKRKYSLCFANKQTIKKPVFSGFF
ncbi:hypothetical protein L0Y49_00740 [bacterium]|nr:hypothetical protein [bacterium]MCI0566233.1 hypothetical protein [bacterium]MCI0680083.1 hypothetical protein [bacterium]